MSRSFPQFLQPLNIFLSLNISFFLLSFQLGDYFINPDFERILNDLPFHGFFSSLSFIQSRSFKCFMTTLTSGCQGKCIKKSHTLRTKQIGGIRWLPKVVILIGKPLSGGCLVYCQCKKCRYTMIPKDDDCCLSISYTDKKCPLHAYYL